MTGFPQGMWPWWSLAPFATSIAVAPAGLRLFGYDSQTADQPPLLLIHGPGDEADTWRHVFGPLSRSYRVVAVDLPGFGRSDKPARGYTLDYYCDTVIALLETLALPTAALAGSSLGGAIAHAVALKAPERVSQLTLVAGTLIQTTPPNETLLFLTEAEAGEAYYNGLRGDPEGAYDNLRPYYADLDALSVPDRGFLYRRANERAWSDGQRDAYLSTLRHWLRYRVVAQARLAEQTRHLKVPTHLIWGACDQIAPLAGARAHIALQPTARLTVLSGAGHLPHQEAPDQFLAALAEVLA